MTMNDRNISLWITRHEGLVGTIIVMVMGQAILFYNAHALTEAGYGTALLILLAVDALAFILAAIVGAVVGAAYLLRLFRHIAFREELGK